MCVAIRGIRYRALDVGSTVSARIEQQEKFKASIYTEVEHSFRVPKQQFGYVNKCYRGLKKNETQIFTLLALGNLWRATHKLMASLG